MALFGFSKDERLKNKKSIQALFDQGERFFEHPFIIVWQTTEDDQSHLKTAISVPKKKIPKAVHRNKIKRQIKEAIRLQQHQLNTKLSHQQLQLQLILIYSQTNIMSTVEIKDKISVTLQRLAEQI
jgi:ribonuclease P protein component